MFPVAEQPAAEEEGEDIPPEVAQKKEKEVFKRCWALRATGVFPNRPCGVRATTSTLGVPRGLSVCLSLYIGRESAWLLDGNRAHTFPTLAPANKRHLQVKSLQ